MSLAADLAVLVGPALEAVPGGVERDLALALKRALDPHGRLNLSKVL